MEAEVTTVKVKVDQAFLDRQLELQNEFQELEERLLEVARNTDVTDWPNVGEGLWITLVEWQKTRDALYEHVRSSFNED
jgi:hypothetical protein